MALTSRFAISGVPLSPTRCTLYHAVRLQFGLQASVVQRRLALLGVVAELGLRVLTKLVDYVGVEGRERGCDDVGVLDAAHRAGGHCWPDVIGLSE